MFKTVKARLKLQYLTVFVLDVFNIITFWSVFRQVYPTWQVFVAASASFVTVLGTVHPPIVAVAHAVCLQSQKAMTKASERYADDVSAAAASVQDLISKGLRLEELTNAVHKIFGRSIALDFAISLYSLTFAVFFSAMVVGASTGPDFLRVPFFFGVTCIFWAAFLLHRLMGPAREGQEIDAMRKKARLGGGEKCCIILYSTTTWYVQSNPVE